MPKIALEKLKQIIREEVQIVETEGEQRKNASSLFDAASKCLDSIEKYQTLSNEKTNSEMGDALERVTQVLKRIVSSPMQYVDIVKPEVTKKKVTLKPVKTD